MNYYRTTWHSNRKSLFMLVMAAVLIAGAGLLLTIVSGGYLFYALAAFVLIGVAASVHYFVWGRTAEASVGLPGVEQPYAAGGEVPEEARFAPGAESPLMLSQDERAELLRLLDRAEREERDPGQVGSAAAPATGARARVQKIREKLKSYED